MGLDKSVDEGWKDSVAQDQVVNNNVGHEPKDADVASQEKELDEQRTPSGKDEDIPVNFINYISSLAFQAMIFLGELPNPMADNKAEKNLRQAKFLIDTLLLLRDKTKGNLSKEEEDLLAASAYELQMKYVELSGQAEKGVLS